MSACSPIKWVGGKSRLLGEILPKFPQQVSTYYEPFLGGGSVFFSSDFERAVLNDFNEELINFYEVLRNDCESLIELITSWKVDESTYYELRAWDRTAGFLKRPILERAARFCYMNRTCFNGVWRINAKHGYNNTPYGHPKHVDFQLDKLRAAAQKLKTARLLSGDFEMAVKEAAPGDFVYFDPPYVPISRTSSFVGYTMDGFSMVEQKRLRRICDELTEKGVSWMLSNSSAPEVFDLYNAYRIERVQVKRLVGGKGSARGTVDEVLVMNY